MKKLLLLSLITLPLIGMSQCISGNCTNGYGIYVFEEGSGWDGDRYAGEWKNDEYHGQGTYTWTSGSKYVGEWKNGNMHGQGTYYYGAGQNKGDFFTGEYKDDKRNGLGVYIFNDGTGDVSYYIDDKEIKRLCDFQK